MGTETLIFVMIGPAIGRKSILLGKQRMRKVWCGRNKGDWTTFINFYEKLFTARESYGVHDCLVELEGIVTDEMNVKLLWPFMVLDVEKALF
jgi:hypothetical protein